MLLCTYIKDTTMFKKNKNISPMRDFAHKSSRKPSATRGELILPTDSKLDVVTGLVMIAVAGYGVAYVFLGFIGQ